MTNKNLTNEANQAKITHNILVKFFLSTFSNVLFQLSAVEQHHVFAFCRLHFLLTTSVLEENPKVFQCESAFKYEALLSRFLFLIQVNLMEGQLGS